MPPKTKITKTRRKKLDSVITKAVNKLCFTLDIKTTNTSPQHGMLLNRFEEPDSQIKNINVSQITYYNKQLDDHVPYTKAELKAMPGYTADTMTFESVLPILDPTEATPSTRLPPTPPALDRSAPQT